MTLILAHRGYAAEYPENTMLAFKEAEKAGADGLELDVQMTKDGELVVIHDEKVDRTTDGTGLVKDYNYKELRKLDARFKFSAQSEKQQIPALDEVLEWLAGTELNCNIELKNTIIPYDGMEEKVIHMIRDYQLSDRIIISSFNHYSIVHSYMMAPDIEIAPLLSDGLYMPWVYAQSIRAKGFHPHWRAAPDEIIKASLESGIDVRPYTVNKDAELERLFRVNCSAVITDDPAKAFQIRGTKKQA
ncbi:glycerophosphodiester phosphodiesterase [Bacillus sp. ISL-35]|uniref:glycerophosphodiester phosphodiesterase n=1 Tax=Bacillus sp. ISL-35 TaxID=2819122 RepID=UPI001BE54F76|nr:glycerophosphodiester phosphodiesterase [Bacillus sp. ISL-35]MBT2677574.1 glycerophosphodiester phosphodiesterase [Bacillus sp. ISL-35]MBT2702038.1 glycerophosphodiester phosphodiesterase [Chryseobacterium sp. ISL-80]